MPVIGLPGASALTQKAVLGGLLVSPDVLGRVTAFVDVRDFYRDGHRRVFAAMRALDVQGTPLDLVTLMSALRQTGDLDEAGGPEYLASSSDGVPRSSNVEHYARLVKQTAFARTGIAICQRAIDVLHTDPSALTNGLPTAHREAWDRLVLSVPTAAPTGLADDGLTDAVDEAREGQALAENGVPELVAGLLPNLGVLGFTVAFAKVGKTTFDQQLGASVAMGRPFLGRDTTPVRVLVVAAEYTAYVARHLNVEPGRMTFYRRPIVLDEQGRAQIVATVQEGGYGLVLIASWQAVVRGLIRDENDNAGAVSVVEAVKAAAHTTGVPWLIDAHSGRSEDQSDDADPSRALRGASAAAGAADFTLSLRYADGAFGRQRRLTGKGRFVSVEPLLLDFDPGTSTYTVVRAEKNAHTETTWRLICEMGALTTTPRSAREIATAAGIAKDTPQSTHTRWVREALAGRPGVLCGEELRRGQKTWTYRLSDEPDVDD